MSEPVPGANVAKTVEAEDREVPHPSALAEQAKTLPEKLKGEKLLSKLKEWMVHLESRRENIHKRLLEMRDRLEYLEYLGDKGPALPYTPDESLNAVYEDTLRVHIDLLEMRLGLVSEEIKQIVTTHLESEAGA